jgi:hypothetical protein
MEPSRDLTIGEYTSDNARRQIDRLNFMISPLTSARELISSSSGDGDSKKEKFSKSWKRVLNHWAESGGVASEAISRLVGMGCLESFPETIEAWHPDTPRETIKNREQVFVSKNADGSLHVHGSFIIWPDRSETDGGVNQHRPDEKLLVKIKMNLNLDTLKNNINDLQNQKLALQKLIPET